MSQSRPLFVYFFVLFIAQFKYNFKSIDVVLGIRNRGCRMVDADGSIDMWGLARDTTNLKHSSIKYTMNRQRIKA